MRLRQKCELGKRSETTHLFAYIQRSPLANGITAIGSAIGPRRKPLRQVCVRWDRSQLCQGKREPFECSDVAPGNGVNKRGWPVPHVRSTRIQIIGNAPVAYPKHHGQTLADRLVETFRGAIAHGMQKFLGIAFGEPNQAIPSNRHGANQGVPSARRHRYGERCAAPRLARGLQLRVHAP